MQATTMTRNLLTALLLAAAAWLPAAHALEIEGVNIDEKITLTRGGP